MPRWRLAWLAHFLPQLPGNGIVYTLTVQDARRVAEWLKRRGINARAYHADLEGGQRVAIENQLLNNELKALVATVALGMGFDKPDLGFVIHFQCCAGGKAQKGIGRAALWVGDPCTSRATYAPSTASLKGVSSRWICSEKSP